MKKLNTWQNLLFQAGGLFLLAGACMPLIGYAREGSLVLLIGALAFGIMQCLAGYEGSDTVVRRLRRQQLLGAFLMIGSGLLAVAHTLNISHIGSGEWKLCFAVAAVLEIYTAFRLPIALHASGEDA